MGLIVVTPYFRGTTDPRAAILGEEQADIVLPVLKLATESAYTDFLKHKLVDWYEASPKSDQHAPSQDFQEERGEEVDGDGEAEEAGESGGGSAMCAMPDMD